MSGSVATISPKRRAKFLVLGALIAGAVVGLIVWAMSLPGATPYFLTVSEFRTEGPLAAGDDYRINGTVVPGSIDRNGLTTVFLITDGKSRLPVATSRPLPDTFRNGSDVVVRGAFDGDRFAASEVLAKCPSKFKAKN